MSSYSNTYWLLAKSLNFPSQHVNLFLSSSLCIQALLPLLRTQHFKLIYGSATSSYRCALQHVKEWNWHKLSLHSDISVFWTATSSIHFKTYGALFIKTSFMNASGKHYKHYKACYRQQLLLQVLPLLLETTTLSCHCLHMLFFLPVNKSNKQLSSSSHKQPTNRYNWK